MIASSCYWEAMIARSWLTATGGNWFYKSADVEAVETFWRAVRASL